MADLIRLLGKLAQDAREKGLGYVASSRAQGLRQRLEVLRARLSKAGRPFRLAGKPYPYLCHAHNTAWLNERTVEVPVVWAEARGHPPEDVLEVGNVLRHYFPCAHAVVDKYEKAPGVLNEDAADYRPGRSFGLIVSISTLEHVGWDEEPRDPPKFERALANLKLCLSPGGRLVFTVPLGYNSHLDSWLFGPRASGESVRFLRRLTADNRWAEVEAAAARGARYGHPFPWANAVAVCAALREF